MRPTGEETMRTRNSGSGPRATPALDGCGSPSRDGRARAVPARRRRHAVSPPDRARAHDRAHIRKTFASGEMHRRARTWALTCGRADTSALLADDSPAVT